MRIHAQNTMIPKSNQMRKLHKENLNNLKIEVSEKEIKALAAEIEQKREEEARLRGDKKPSLFELLISKMIGKKYRFATGIDEDVVDSEKLAEEILTVRRKNILSLESHQSEGAIPNRFEGKV